MVTERNLDVQSRDDVYWEDLHLIGGNVVDNGSLIVHGNLTLDKEASLFITNGNLIVEQLTKEGKGSIVVNGEIIVFGNIITHCYIAATEGIYVHGSMHCTTIDDTPYLYVFGESLGVEKKSNIFYDIFVPEGRAYFCDSFSCGRDAYFKHLDMQQAELIVGHSLKAESSHGLNKVSIGEK